METRDRLRELLQILETANKVADLAINQIISMFNSSKTGEYINMMPRELNISHEHQKIIMQIEPIESHIECKQGVYDWETDTTYLITYTESLN